MAKKKTKKPKVKSLEPKNKCTARLWWPGPTRLYDDEADCGAVMLTGEQARTLVMAVERNCDYDDPSLNGDRLWAAIQSIRATFRIDDAFPLV